MKVRVVDEAGRLLPARVHLRDAECRYLLAPGHETRQRAMHDKTGPMCGDWFYTDGEFSIEVGAGEAQIDIAHGPEYAGIHETIAIAAGQTVEKIYTLRRLIDLVALGWYNGDEHLHQPPDSTMMRAECLNIVGTPVCNGAKVHYSVDQTVAQLPDALDNWLAALRNGRSFVSNRPLLFVTIDGQEPGSELAIKSGTELSVDIRAISATPISRIDIMHQGRILKQIDIEAPATDIRRSEKITLPKSGWLAVRCFGLGQNMNLGPKFAFAHTSPFYAIVDGQAIGSPEDARFFHEKFSDYVQVTVPFVENEAVRHALEAMCRDALAKWATQAELR